MKSLIGELGGSSCGYLGSKNKMDEAVATAKGRKLKAEALGLRSPLVM